MRYRAALRSDRMLSNTNRGAGRNERLEHDPFKYDRIAEAHGSPLALRQAQGKEARGEEAHGSTSSP